MKWSDITLIEEPDVIQLFNSYAIDLFIPLIKKGVDKISYDKFKKNVEDNNDISLNIDLDDDFFIDNLIKLDCVDKIEPDESDHMVIWLKTKNNDMKKINKSDEDDNDNVEQMAADQAVKEIKKG